MRVLSTLLFAQLLVSQNGLYSALELSSFNLPNLSYISARNPAISDSLPRVRSSYRSQFSIKELRIYSFVYSNKNYGVELHSLNFSLYQLSEVSSFYAFSPWQDMRIGLALNGRFQAVKNYGNKNRYSATISMLQQGKSYSFFANVYNVKPSDLHERSYHLAIAERQGFLRWEYQILRHSYVEQVLSLHCDLHTHLKARISHHLERGEFAFTLSTNIQNYHVYYALQVHSELGESHGISLAMSF